MVVGRDGFVNELDRPHVTQLAGEGVQSSRCRSMDACSLVRFAEVLN